MSRGGGLAGAAAGTRTKAVAVDMVKVKVKVVNCLIDCMLRVIGFESEELFSVSGELVGVYVVLYRKSP